MVHGEVSESVAVSLPDPLWLPYTNIGEFSLQTVQLPQLWCFQIVSVFECSFFTVQYVGDIVWYILYNIGS